MDPPTYLQQPPFNHHLDVYTPTLMLNGLISSLLSSSKLGLLSVLLQEIQSCLL